MVKSVLAYTVSIDAVSLGTTYDITLGGDYLKLQYCFLLVRVRIRTPTLHFILGYICSVVITVLCANLIFVFVFVFIYFPKFQIQEYIQWI